MSQIPKRLTERMINEAAMQVGAHWYGVGSTSVAFNAQQWTAFKRKLSGKVQLPTADQSREDIDRIINDWVINDYVSLSHTARDKLAGILYALANQPKESP